MSILCGGLYWLETRAATEEATALSHPHLIVQSDVLNRSRVETVVVCALTSNLGRASEPGNVLLEPGEGDLPKHSVIVVSQISSVPKSACTHYIGQLSEERVKQALSGLAFQQRSFQRDR